MSNQVYKKDAFIIFPVRNGYIVYNEKKEFKLGHSHLRSYNAAKLAIELVKRKKVPTCNSFYYLRTLQRISDDIDYISNIENLIQIRRQKGPKEKLLKYSLCRSH